MLCEPVTSFRGTTPLPWPSASSRGTGRTSHPLCRCRWQTLVALPPHPEANSPPGPCTALGCQLQLVSTQQHPCSLFRRAPSSFTSPLSTSVKTARHFGRSPQCLRTDALRTPAPCAVSPAWSSQQSPAAGSREALPLISWRDAHLPATLLLRKGNPSPPRRMGMSRRFLFVCSLSFYT